MKNGLSHPYHLDESTFIFRGIRSNFSFLFNLSMKFMPANRIAPDGTPHFAMSHLGLFCLPMSHKKDARLIWVKLLSVVLHIKQPLHYSNQEACLLNFHTFCLVFAMTYKTVYHKKPHLKIGQAKSSKHCNYQSYIFWVTP